MQTSTSSQSDMPKLLSDQDEALLTQIVRKVMKQTVNSPYRQSDGDRDGSPEVYVAKIPEDGIPGREDEVLGEAECEIFRIIKDGSDHKLIEIESVVTRKKMVYNIHPIAVPFNEDFPYFAVFRTKHGQWICEAPQVASSGHYIAKLQAGGLSARVGTTVGGGTVDIYKIEGGVLTDTGVDQSVANIYPIPVAFDAAVPYLQIDQDQFGIWLNEMPQMATGAFLGVPFQNASGFTVPPGGVMRCIDGVNIGGIPHILTYRPSNTIDNFWLINSQTAVPDTGVGFGSFLTDLVGFVAINSFETPGTLANWGPTPNSFVLSENGLGFFPLQAAAYTINGQRCGYFKGRFISELLGKWYDTLVQNSSALFQPYAVQTPGHKFGLTGGWDKIEAYDFWLQLNQQVKSGTKGKVIWYANSWVMDLTHCEVSNTQETFNSSRLMNNFDAMNQMAVSNAGFANQPGSFAFNPPPPMQVTPMSIATGTPGISF